MAHQGELAGRRHSGGRRAMIQAAEYGPCLGLIFARLLARRVFLTLNDFNTRRNNEGWQLTFRSISERGRVAWVIAPTAFSDPGGASGPISPCLTGAAKDGDRLNLHEDCGLTGPGVCAIRDTWLMDTAQPHAGK